MNSKIVDQATLELTFEKPPEFNHQNGQFDDSVITMVPTPGICQFLAFFFEPSWRNFA